ncbi:hypothetical protein OAV86_04795 [Pseudomonadales bacterium]|nr:hypothetical protein [Pseudomonadales bacterium]
MEPDSFVIGCLGTAVNVCIGPGARGPRLGKRYPDRLMVLLPERAMVLAASQCAAAVLVHGYLQQALPDRI